MVNIPKTPYYHGTSLDSAKNIINNGINPNKLQSRDRGFFGDGFYTCVRPDTAKDHATTVASKEPTILKINISKKAKILFAGETFESHKISPQKKPSWHQEFINWSLKKVEDAAVWEYATDKSKETILENARDERTPGSGKFNRTRWYNEVTNFADENGYDIVYWTDSEIIIKNYDIIDNISIY